MNFFYTNLYRYNDCAQTYHVFCHIASLQFPTQQQTTFFACALSLQKTKLSINLLYYLKTKND